MGYFELNSRTALAYSSVAFPSSLLRWFRSWAPALWSASRTFSTRFSAALTSSMVDMITRYRTPVSSPATILTCNGCDSANNDWESVTREPVDIYTLGTDTHFWKKAFLSAYYTLSAGKGNVYSRPLGDPTLTAPGPDQFLLTGTNAAVDYPETVNRNHELDVIFKYKLTEHVSPKFEYRYQQWDYKDYQTSPMTQYMGCVSPIPNGPPVTNAVPGCTTPILTSNTPNPAGVGSPFYPYFAVGDTSSARYLFLGVDQPSYRAHTVIASIEFHF